MSQINSNTKDDFQVVFLLSCFVGHPVFNITLNVLKWFKLYCEEMKCEERRTIARHCTKWRMKGFKEGKEKEYRNL